MNAASQLAREVGTAPACAAVGVARATFYRHQRVTDWTCQKQPRPTPPRALSAEERQVVLGACTPSGSSIRRPPRFTPRCSTKTVIYARFARCTAC